MVKETEEACTTAAMPERLPPIMQVPSATEPAGPARSAFHVLRSAQQLLSLGAAPSVIRAFVRADAAAYRAHQEAQQAVDKAWTDACRRTQLPHLSDEIFVHIASFADVRTLGRLACAAPRYSVQSIVPDSNSLTEMHSVIDEGARRQLLRLEDWQTALSTRIAGESWHKTLHSVHVQMRPKRFSVTGPLVHLTETRTVATMLATEHFQTAVVGQEMHSGIHYAEFRRFGGPAYMGLVGVEFDPEQFDSDDWVRPCQTMISSPHGWGYAPGSGQLCHDTRKATWAPDNPSCDEHDVVGLLLDITAQTVTMYRNGCRSGIMIHPSMTDDIELPIHPLVPPLRWAVDLSERGAVRFNGPLPPPGVRRAGRMPPIPSDSLIDQRQIPGTRRE